MIEILSLSIKLSSNFSSRSLVSGCAITHNTSWLFYTTSTNTKMLRHFSSGCWERNRKTSQVLGWKLNGEICWCGRNLGHFHVCKMKMKLNHVENVLEITEPSIMKMNRNFHNPFYLMNANIWTHQIINTYGLCWLWRQWWFVENIKFNVYALTRLCQ